jgi:hypothetical protein
MKGKNRPAKPVISGDLLVSDFISAITNLSTAETAKYVARRTEQETMEALRSVGANTNPVFLTPADIDPQAQAHIARSSLDAHLQKAQSEQISAFTNQQVSQMEASARQTYAGKKVRIAIVDKAFEPIESVWFDKRTGNYRRGVIKKGSIKGSIDEISFGQNRLVIKPSLGGRLLVPDRKFFFVYPVNPETLAPAVKISLI